MEEARTALQAERQRLTTGQMTRDIVRERLTVRGTEYDDPTCHPNGKWVFSPDAASSRAKAYETQITGMPADIDYDVPGVKFDGCDPGSRDLPEAKGPGYEGLAGRIDKYFAGQFIEHDALRQMSAQSRVAPPSQVLWHVAEQPVARRLARFARTQQFNRVQVNHTPVN